MIKILIAEEAALLRDALADIINGQEDMRVTGVSADAGKALGLCRELAPDLALIGGAGGIEAAAEIRRELPDIKVAIMAAADTTFMDAAREAGAHSFLCVRYDFDSRHLLYVIRCTMNGRGFYPGPVDEPIAKIRFSDDETAVIRLVCRGKSRREIASALSMSEESVKAVVAAVLNKTGFGSIMKFSVYAVARGFIAPKGAP